MAVTAKLWWIASDPHELQVWREKYPGVSFEARPRPESDLLDVVLTLDKHKANQLLGYTPEESEWLED